MVDLLTSNHILETDKLQSEVHNYYYWGYNFLDSYYGVPGAVFSTKLLLCLLQTDWGTGTVDFHDLATSGK